MIDAQEYLSLIALYDTHIRNKTEDIANMNDLATRVTTAMKDVVVFTNGNGDKIGNAAAEICDLRDEIQRDVQEYCRKKREACGVIDKVRNQKQLDLLQKHYVLHKPLDQVAREMGYSERHLNRIHEAALETIERILKAEGYDNS